MKDFKHTKEHQQEHIHFSRRNFLSTIGLAGAGSLLLGNLNITGLQANPLMSVLNSLETDKILILIRLAGGNDGLNTIIPLNQYSEYANKRPSIKIPQNNIISLQSEFGMPNFMNPLLPFWNEGNMSVVHGVGYPNQDLSHFTSTDIWSSAKASTPNQTGWLGNYLANEFPDFLFNPPTVPPAIQIGSSTTFQAEMSNNIVDLGFSVSDPAQMAAIAQNGELYNIANTPDCYYGEQLQYLRSITNNTYKYTNTIFNAYQNAQNTVNYTPNELSEQLALIARLIKGGLGSKIYMVNLRGFDTHDEQAQVHQNLLTNLSSAVAEFYEDLGENWQNKVLSMAFSEFGRRIEENASKGTDHGAAAPILLFGGALNATNEQSFGEIPNLNQPDATGNLQFNVDFRSVYATLLQNWLCVPAEIVDSILPEVFPRIEHLLPACNSTTSNNNAPIVAQNSIAHQVKNNGSTPILTVQLSLPQIIDIAVFDISGRNVATLFSGYLAAGTHDFEFSTHDFSLPRGAYLYQIRTKKGVFSGKLMQFAMR